MGPLLEKVDFPLVVAQSGEIASIGPVLLPVATGMWLRYRYTRVVSRYSSFLRRFSLAALAGLIAIILIDQDELLTVEFGSIVTLAISYSLCAIGAGWGLGWLARMPPDERFTLLVEFATRNLAITALIGAAVLGRMEYVLFSTLFFLLQTPILLLLISGYRTYSNPVKFWQRR